MAWVAIRPMRSASQHFDDAGAGSRCIQAAEQGSSASYWPLPCRVEDVVARQPVGHAAVEVVHTVGGGGGLRRCRRRRLRRPWAGDQALASLHAHRAAGGGTPGRTSSSPVPWPARCRSGRSVRAIRRLSAGNACAARGVHQRMGQLGVGVEHPGWRGDEPGAVVVQIHGKALPPSRSRRCRPKAAASAAGSLDSKATSSVSRSSCRHIRSRTPAG